MQLAIDLDDRLDEITAGDKTTAHDLAANDAIRLIALATIEFEGLALEEGQQHRLGDRVVAVRLFENLELGLTRNIAQDDRIRFDLRRDTGEGDLIDARLEVQWQRFAHHREASVIDSERRIGSEGRGSGGQQEEHGEFHGVREMINTGSSFPILISEAGNGFSLGQVDQLNSWPERGAIKGGSTVRREVSWGPIPSSMQPSVLDSVLFHQPSPPFSPPLCPPYLPFLLCFRRYSDGVQPISRKNKRLKKVTWAKPQARAMSRTLRSLSRSSRRAACSRS